MAETSRSASCSPLACTLLRRVAQFGFSGLANLPFTLEVVSQSLTLALDPDGDACEPGEKLKRRLRLVSPLPQISTNFLAMLFPALTTAQQMLFFTVLLLLLLPAFATAGHTVCSWKPGDLTPDHYGFTLYCRGTLNKINDTAITYSCGRTGREMASWGMLAPDKLEFSE